MRWLVLSWAVYPRTGGVRSASMRLGRSPVRVSRRVRRRSCRDSAAVMRSAPSSVLVPIRPSVLFRSRRVFKYAEPGPRSQSGSSRSRIRDRGAFCGRQVEFSCDQATGPYFGVFRLRRPATSSRECAPISASLVFADRRVLHASARRSRVSRVRRLASSLRESPPISASFASADRRVLCASAPRFRCRSRPATPGLWSGVVSCTVSAPDGLWSASGAVFSPAQTCA